MTVKHPCSGERSDLKTTPGSKELDGRSKSSRSYTAYISSHSLHSLPWTRVSRGFVQSLLYYWLLLNGTARTCSKLGVIVILQWMAPHSSHLGTLFRIILHP